MSCFEELEYRYVLDACGPVVGPLDAFDDEYETSEDEVLTVDAPGILCNDKRPDGETLTITHLNGTAPPTPLVLESGAYYLIVQDGGEIVYLPNDRFDWLAEGETATDQFTYTVEASNGSQDTATVTITVAGVNDVPETHDIGGSVSEVGPPIVVEFSADDVDGDDDPDSLVYTITSPPDEGSVHNNLDGTFTFDPGSDFHDLALGETRDVSFEFTATDSHGAVSNTATVTITVSGSACQLIAGVDLITTHEGNSITFPTGDLLQNDFSSSGEFSIIDVDDNLTKGLIFWDTDDNTVTYDPNGKFESLGLGDTETDLFRYTISDGQCGTDTATVDVRITGVNRDPHATDNSYSTDEDVPISGNMITDDTGNGSDTDPDGDILMVTRHTDPEDSFDATSVEGGTVVGSGDGTFTYTPPKDFNGNDSFDYMVADGNGGVAQATVHIAVNRVNDDPTAEIDTAITDEDTPIPMVNVLVNDSDVDGDLLTIHGSNATSIKGGTVVDNGDGTLKYTPPVDFNGLDSFEYTVTDGNGGIAEATVLITVRPVNDAPSFIVGPSQTVFEDVKPRTYFAEGWANAIRSGPNDEADQVLSFRVTSNDLPDLFAKDINGEPQISVTPDGTLVFSTAPNITGTAKIGIALHDDGGATSNGTNPTSKQTFEITVRPPPSPIPPSDQPDGALSEAMTATWTGQTQALNESTETFRWNDSKNWSFNVPDSDLFVPGFSEGAGANVVFPALVTDVVRIELAEQETALVRSFRFTGGNYEILGAGVLDFSLLTDGRNVASNITVDEPSTAVMKTAFRGNLRIQGGLTLDSAMVDGNVSHASSDGELVLGGITRVTKVTDGIVRLVGISETTIIHGGKLILGREGNENMEAVQGFSGRTEVNGGLLSGTGNLESLNVGRNGTVSPGESIGTLEVVSDVTIDGTLEVNLSSIPEEDAPVMGGDDVLELDVSDQLHVTGHVNLDPVTSKLKVVSRTFLARLRAAPTKDELDQLDNMAIPEFVNNELAANAHPLTMDAELQVIEAGTEWRIQDQETTFLIKVEDGSLNAYTAPSGWSIGSHHWTIITASSISGEFSNNPIGQHVGVGAFIADINFRQETDSGVGVRLSAFQAAAGDANGDGFFDQFDLLSLHIGGKFLTGQSADWTEGDFNGDSVFDQDDIVLFLADDVGFTEHYLKGSYLADILNTENVKLT